jgi:DNA-binding transcriptional MerR regulator
MTDSMTADATFTVGEAAAQSGFSVDTLRYYERLGLLTGVDRTAGGRRRYTADDLGWLSLVSCLRGTGMPVREMQEFAELVRAGDQTFPQRRALLQAHRERVLAHIAALREQLRMIDHKIDYYAKQKES